jgi:hypothetical protein
LEIKLLWRLIVGHLPSAGVNFPLLLSQEAGFLCGRFLKFILHYSGVMICKICEVFFGGMMREFRGMFLVVCLASSTCYGQDSATTDKAKFADAARARYYNSVSHGLVSFSCDVKVNWDTVPKAMMIPLDLVGRDGLEQTRITVSQGARVTAKVTHDYAKGTPAAAGAAYEPFFGWLSNLVQGFMMTWAAKGLEGPIPPEGNIDHVNVSPSGYRVILVNPGVQLVMTKDFLVTEILTSGAGDQVDEHPLFTATSDGWLFTANQAVEKQGNNLVNVKYEVDYRAADDIQVPHNIHLVVNDNVDIKFSFEGCSAERGTVIKVKAPPPN